MGIYYGTLTTKGQTTVPAEVRELLDLKSGNRIRYVTEGDRVYISAKNKSALELAGMLHEPDRKPFSVEEIDETIAEYLADDDKRVSDDWNRHQRSSEVHPRG